MGAPQTLPADFNQWDSAPSTLPADFNKWDESRAATAPAKPGLLDKEIPLDSYTHATESGLQSVGRGARDAVVGTLRMFDPRPQNDEEESVAGSMPGGHAVLPVYRMLRSFGHSAEDATQLAGALHDINQSPDPVGTYAKVAQETAGQGAGQALVAAGTEGLLKGASAAKPALAKAAKATAGVIRDVATPENIATAAGGAAGAAAGHVVGAPFELGAGGAMVGKAVGKAIAKKLVGEGSEVLDATGENKPFAGGADEPTVKPAKELDATGENKPFAGGMDEPLPPKKPAQSAKAAPRTVVVDPKTGAPEFSDVVAANSPESTDLHMSALDQAKAKLGPQAPVGDVLQEAAKIQQAGPKAVRTVVMDETTGRPEFSDVVEARKQQAAQAPPAKSNPRVAADIANWQPPPQLGVTSAPDYGAAARADVERHMGGALPRGTAAAELELTPEAQNILQQLKGHAQQIEAQNAQEASVPKPEDDLTDILERSIEAVKQKRLAAKKARTIQ
jgi:hypothetical protein